MIPKKINITYNNIVPMLHYTLGKWVRVGDRGEKK
jgi:hypothetical protein